MELVESCRPDRKSRQSLIDVVDRAIIASTIPISGGVENS
jgi:hypothetical protein